MKPHPQSIQNFGPAPFLAYRSLRWLLVHGPGKGGGIIDIFIDTLHYKIPYSSGVGVGLFICSLMVFLMGVFGHLVRLLSFRGSIYYEIVEKLVHRFLPISMGYSLYTHKKW